MRGPAKPQLSLEDLNTDLKRPPVLVQVSARSQPRLDTASCQQPLVAQYSVRSEVGAVKMRPRLITTSSEPQRPGLGGSMARTASAEDMRIETETVVTCPLSKRGQSTVV